MKRPLSILLLFAVVALAPFVNAQDTNLSTVPDDWGFYSEYGYVKYGSNPQLCHVDYDVTYMGAPSIRMDGPASAENPARELEWTGDSEYSIPVSPGDRILFNCWIKAASSTRGDDGDDGHGGIIGIDFYHDNNRVWEYAHGTTTTWQLTNPIFAYVQDYIWVPYGTGQWTKITLDVTVPDTMFTTDDYGTSLGGSYQLNYAMPWLTGSWHHADESASVWFANMQIYINPSESVPTAAPSVDSLPPAANGAGATPPDSAQTTLALLLGVGGGLLFLFYSMIKRD